MKTIGNSSRRTGMGRWREVGRAFDADGKGCSLWEKSSDGGKRWYPRASTQLMLWGPRESRWPAPPHHFWAAPAPLNVQLLELAIPLPSCSGPQCDTIPFSFIFPSKLPSQTNTRRKLALLGRLGYNLWSHYWLEESFSPLGLHVLA